MACTICEHKGYIEVNYLRDGRVKTSVRMCEHCKDVTAYSRRVQYGSEFGEMRQRVVKNRRSHLHPVPGGKDG